MHVRGSVSPETEVKAQERYEAVGSTAQVVVREVAKAMSFDRDEYERRVTPSVIETARDALFAQQLAVTVGDRSEFEDWLASSEYDVIETGSENVDNVAWHAAPFAGEVAAATFQHEEDAAVETVRRQAFGRIYRNRLEQ